MKFGKTIKIFRIDGALNARMSPSTLAVMVMGRSANGLTEWRNKNGKTLKEFETNNLISKFKGKMGKHIIH